ncbi:DUF58 domain-containing protein [Microbacterium sp. DT81.1]|uniref:DUF58 domain-containing protein n=1 Tax=Microbacterium sp. DT81.1 TaxID=3393413 RepID=UPI003CF70DC7
MTTDAEPRLTRLDAASAATAHTRVTTASRGPLVRGLVALISAARRTRDGVDAAVDWVGQVVTPAGWLVLASATIGVSVGWIFGWVEWLVAGFAAVMLLAMSIPFLFGARAYDVAVRLDHERVVAGGEVAGEVEIRNRGARATLPGRIDLPVGSGLVELGVPLLRARHVVSQPVTIPTPRRGVHTVGPPTSVRTDPIGLLRREHAWPDVHELFVHPRTAAVPSTSAGLVRDLEGNPTRRLVDADMSFHAIRPYTPGDSRRQIHWKSTAKTGQLMVRQFEESRRSRMAVVLSLALDDYADDDEFELGVSAAASLGAQAIRDGRDLDIVTGASIPRVVKGRLRAIQNLEASSPRALLDGFSALEGLEHTMPVEEVCRLAVEASDALSIAFVVCGSKVGLTRIRQAALAFPADTAVLAVLCDERAHPRVQPVGSLTLLTIGLIDDLPALLLRGVQS